jgi:hypothetical protein
MNMIVGVAFDCLNDGDLSLQRHVHDVGALLWPQSHPIPALTSTPNTVMLSRRFSGSCSHPIVIAR